MRQLTLEGPAECRWRDAADPVLQSPAQALVRPLAGACSQKAWPYFEAACLRDARNPYGEARQVRVVALDDVAPAGTGRR